ncbi:MAG TPA: glycerophosphodiester phosphodiesterase [Acidimicrobiales bacterium]|nr:glycerophosphodiester phosphodiesterase [Acidimicrobiales bacterium]
MSADLALRRLRPEISWHRGGAELAPAASLGAFAQAARRGAEFVEVDLRRTGDGALVCVHDADLPGLGAVSELSWSSPAVRRAAAGRVFELGQFLDVLDEEDPGRRSGIHLDLKEVGFEREAVDAVLGRARRLFVTSSEEASVSAVRAARPEVAALLTLGRDGRGLRPAELARLRAGELVPFSRVERSGATGVAVHYLLATPALRAVCRLRGLTVVVWTVDGDRQLARWLGRRYVDVVVTDRPLAATALRDRAVAR